MRTRVGPGRDAEHGSLEQVRASVTGMEGLLSIGFQGSGTDHLMHVIELLHLEYPGCSPELVEIPLADPFGAMRRDDVNAAVVLLPMGEPDLFLGQIFSEQPRMLVVASTHPFARRAELSVEDLANVVLIGVRGPAPEYWRRA